MAAHFGIRPVRGRGITIRPCGDVIDDRGRVYRGARAVNEILRRQAGMRSLIAYLWYLPGYAWLADRQYKAIAGRRYRFGAAGKTDGAVGTAAARQP